MRPAKRARLSAGQKGPGAANDDDGTAQLRQPARQEVPSATHLLDLPDLVLAVIAHATGRTARLICTRLCGIYDCPGHGLSLWQCEGDLAEAVMAWPWPQQVHHLRTNQVTAPETAPLLAAVAARLRNLRCLAWYGGGDADRGRQPFRTQLVRALRSCCRILDFRPLLGLLMPATVSPIPSLTSLTWDNGSPGCTFTLIPHLAPNLKHLRLQLRPHLWSDLAGNVTQMPFTAMMQRLPHLTSLQLDIHHESELWRHDTVRHDVAAGLLATSPTLAALSLPNSIATGQAPDMPLGPWGTLSQLTSLTIGCPKYLNALPDAITQRLKVLDFTPMPKREAGRALRMFAELDPHEYTSVECLRLPSVGRTDGGDSRREVEFERALHWVADKCTALTSLRVGALDNRCVLKAWLAPVGAIATLQRLHVDLLTDHCQQLVNLASLTALTYMSVWVDAERGFRCDRVTGPVNEELANALQQLDSVQEFRLQLHEELFISAAQRAAILLAGLALPALRVLDLTPVTDLTAAELQQVLGAMGKAALLRKLHLHELCLAWSADRRDAMLGVLQQLPGRVEVEWGHRRALV